MIEFDLDTARSAIRNGGYWYLASPYSRYPDGIEAAFQEASRAAGALIRVGVPVYCPISHTHPIAIHSGTDPICHSTWLPLDKAFVDTSVGMIICTMPTWESSFGIKQEVKWFQEAGKLVMLMKWPAAEGVLE